MTTERATTTNTDTMTLDSTQEINAIDVISEEVAEETAQGFNFEPIADFKADLKGAERLFWKGVKLINRYANITVNQWDRQDAISAIYIAVMTQEQAETDIPLSPISQQYFGISTREQFRAGYNALQKIVYQNRQQATKREYNQEYGQSGTHTKSEIEEVELDLTLQSILTEQYQTFLEYKLQGYSIEEMAEITGIARGTVKWYQSEIRKILAEAFKVDTKQRKLTKIQKKKPE